MSLYVKELNDDIWIDGEKRSKELPIYKNSHRQIEANQVGVLGEIIAEIWMRHLNITFEEEKYTTHDYRLSKINKTFDVKTKDRTVYPKLTYDCSVPLYNHLHQLPDFYLFISLMRDKTITGSNIRSFKKAYILGMCDQKLLHEKGIVWKKGQTDPENGTTFWTDCINLKIYQLISPSDISKIWS